MHLKVFPMKDLKHVVGIIETKHKRRGWQNGQNRENKHIYENKEFVPI